MKFVFYFYFPDCHYLNNFVVGFRISGSMASREFRDDEAFFTQSGRSVRCGETVVAMCHDCTSTYARYVYIMLRGLRALMICEVEVYMEGEYCSCFLI